MNIAISYHLCTVCLFWGLQSSICPLSELPSLSCISCISCIAVLKNSAPDTNGGKRFNQELGADSMREVLQDAANYIQGALNLSKPKAIATVTLIIASFAGVAQIVGSEIQLSSDYIASQPNDT